MAAPPYKAAGSKLESLVQQASAAVNRWTGAVSRVRRIGVDPSTPRGVRVAGVDAVVIGADDAKALRRAGRFYSGDRQFREAAQALTGVVGAVADLAVEPYVAPGGPGWETPADRDHLAVRADYAAIQAAVSGACTRAAFHDVVSDLADQGVVRQQFADLVRTKGRPQDPSPLTAAGEGFVGRLSETTAETGPDYRTMLARLNRCPPEHKADEAADRLLASVVPDWEIVEDHVHAARLRALAGQIEQDFADLGPSASQQDGRQIGDRAVATARRIAADLAPAERFDPQPERAPASVAFEGTVRTAHVSPDSVEQDARQPTGQPAPERGAPLDR